jgi:hypothetical protein
MVSGAMHNRSFSPCPGLSLPRLQI